MFAFDRLPWPLCVQETEAKLAAEAPDIVYGRPEHKGASRPAFAVTFGVMVTVWVQVDEFP